MLPGFVGELNALPSPFQPAGLRHCNGAAFASFQPLAALDVFNADCVVTEPKDAPCATTGEGKCSGYFYFADVLFVDESAAGENDIYVTTKKFVTNAVQNQPL
ncbi:MAG: hypothetical protein Q7T76_06230 [Ferruginibacter sp.]|nr:hypothetical protein [Ferruginibacter sp.]